MGNDAKSDGTGTVGALVLLREVHDHLIKAHPFSDDAPGHSHNKRGHWDADGSPCPWCKTWERVKMCLEQNARNHDSSDSEIA